MLRPHHIFLKFGPAKYWIKCWTPFFLKPNPNSTHLSFYRDIWNSHSLNCNRDKNVRAISGASSLRFLFQILFSRLQKRCASCRNGTQPLRLISSLALKVGFKRSGVFLASEFEKKPHKKYVNDMCIFACPFKRNSLHCSRKKYIGHRKLAAKQASITGEALGMFRTACMLKCTA